MPASVTAWLKRQCAEIANRSVQIERGAAADLYHGCVQQRAGRHAIQTGEAEDIDDTAGCGRQRAAEDRAGRQIDMGIRPGRQDCAASVIDSGAGNDQALVGSNRAGGLDQPEIVQFSVAKVEDQCPGLIGVDDALRLINKLQIAAAADLSRPGNDVADVVQQRWRRTADELGLSLAGQSDRAGPGKLCVWRANEDRRRRGRAGHEDRAASTVDGPTQSQGTAVLDHDRAVHRHRSGSRPIEATGIDDDGAPTRRGNGAASYC